MKTVLYEIIDELEIVTGFSSLSLDPVATRKMINAEIQASPQQASFEKAAKEYQNMRARIRARAKPGIPVVISKMEAHEMGVAKRDVQACRDTLAEFRVQLRGEIKVYFEPLTNEKVVEDGALKASFDTLEKYRSLTTDGAIIPNYRDVKFFDSNWVPGTVSRIGKSLPLGAIIDVTKEQRVEMMKHRETNRILALSRDELEKEKGTQLKNAAAQCAMERSILEIEGETSHDALKIAKIAYGKLKEEIEEKYG